MNTSQRAHYFGRLWPAACQAKGWSAKDESRRRATTLACMAAIRSAPIESTSKLDEDRITALFCYLRHLANPDSLDMSARWATCQEDYRAFARSKQSDWHERELYGEGKNKLDRNRFAGETSAAGGPLESLDADKVRKRHMTFASRHQRKLRQEAAKAREQAAGVDLATHAPEAASVEQDPAYVPPRDQPF